MKGPVLLLVEGADAAARVAVGRAHALSVIVGDALHVIRLLGEPHGERGNELALFEAERELRRVCRAELPEALGADRLEVRSGDVMTEALAAIARIGAGLLVLGSGPRAGALAAELASRSSVPVLVARPPRPLGAIVAATDLAHPGYPVVQLVARLRSRLESPVALLHNVAPVRLLDDDGCAAAEREQTVAEQTRRLHQVAAELLPGAELQTLQRGSAAVAILEAGARSDCDLIVVGVPARPRSAFDAAVAEDVVRGAQSSVLVAPLT
ncbi:MAG: universal stress protein [Archangiaceae bacterium]|nr:universal stress protein [Archangiaceae bacterium]